MASVTVAETDEKYSPPVVKKSMNENGANDDLDRYHNDDNNENHEISDSSSLSSSSSTSSIDTQDAFLEMLGLLPTGSGGRELPSLEVKEIIVSDENDNTTKEEEKKDDKSSCNNYHDKNKLLLEVSRIQVPTRCSRYLHSPETCCAMTIRNFYTKLECDQLIHHASTFTDRGFQYIKEATHVSPYDGTTYTVQLQNPNPHKLSVFYHPPTIKHMWSTLVQDVKLVSHLQSYMNRTKCGPPLGLNPKLRVLRYDSSDNDRFEPHFDATTYVGDGPTNDQQRSHLTVLLYLNDGGGHEFDGGETWYLNSHISTSNHHHLLTTPMKNKSRGTRGNADNNDHDNHDSHVDDHNVTKITPQTGKVVIFEHDLYHSGAPLLWGTKYVLRTDILFAVKDDDSNDDDNRNNNHSGPDSTYDGNSKKKNNDTTKTASLLLVSELCKELGLSTRQTNLLNDMDMFEITLESFLAPGITMLKTMLMDELQDESVVNQLIHKAIQVVKDT